MAYKTLKQCIADLEQQGELLRITKEVNPDLEDYVTQKTIDGLFMLIAQEEKNIRENPKARVSELLQKVFK